MELEVLRAGGGADRPGARCAPTTAPGARCAPTTAPGAEPGAAPGPPPATTPTPHTQVPASTATYGAGVNPPSAVQQQQLDDGYGSSNSSPHSSGELPNNLTQPNFDTSMKEGHN